MTLEEHLKSTTVERFEYLDKRMSEYAKDFSNHPLFEEFLKAHVDYVLAAFRSPDEFKKYVQIKETRSNHV